MLHIKLLCSLLCYTHVTIIKLSYFEFAQVVQEEKSFKDISYLGLWPPFCSAERSHLCSIGRGHYEEPSCEVILKLDQWFRRMSFKEKVYGQTEEDRSQ